MYLVQNKSGFCFRLNIPADLQNQIGIKELRRSLKGKDHRTASQLSLLIAGKIHQLFRKLRAKDMGLTAHQIKQMVNGFIHECLDYEENARTSYEPVYNGEGDSPYIPDEHLTVVDDFSEDAQQQLKSGDYSKVGKVVDHILGVNECQIPKDSLDYKKMCRETLKAQIKMLTIEKQRNEGDYSDDDKLPPRPERLETEGLAPTTPPEPAPSGPLLKKLVEEWRTENITANNWKPRTINAYQGHFRVMMQILGDDIQIDSIDHRTVRTIKSTLLKLPSGMNKKKIFKNRPLSEIFKLNETEKLETLSVTTVNKYLITLGAFFKWCVGNGYMNTNFADGMKIKISKQKRPDEIRHAFTTDQLNSMFQSPYYRNGTFDKPYQFWLPILGLYTGARLNELCQLRLKDIQTVDGIYSFVFQEDQEDPTISLKNAASHRTVPLHPFVSNDLNFKGYVDQLKKKGETRLFPSLPYQNYNYGHKASKWFKEFRVKCGIVSSQLVFHSFRHTLSDNLKQQLITESLIDELTGHALQGETMGRYGKRYKVDVLYKEAVLKLDYTKVDLDHLKNSKHTGPQV